MMQQYHRIKNEHQDALLFYRLGDFYEMFEEDARTGSRLLGLTLTHRQGVPMCGVPYHAAHSYIGRLLHAGKKVAVCEQVRLPEKGLAERAVVEVLSPATVFEEDFLEPDRNNFLLAVCRSGETLNLAWTDASTGKLDIASFTAGEPWETILLRELSRIQPREILIAESILEDSAIVERELRSRSDITVNRYPDWSFDRDTGFSRIREILHVANLRGFGIEQSEPALSALAVLLQYLEDNARHSMNHIFSIRKHLPDGFVILDDATQRNLELTANMQSGGRDYTLFSLLNNCRTGMGARLLRQRLVWPLRDVEKIELRLERVEELYRNQDRLYRLREILSDSFDLERLIARLGVDKAHPRDVLAVAATVSVTGRVQVLLPGWIDDGTGRAIAPGGTLDLLADLIRSTLVDDPPVTISEGGIIRPGVDADLDRYRSMERDGKGMLDAYLDEQRSATGINSLKIKYNRMLGHFFELPQSQSPNVPDYFIRRQSLTNAERFTTTRLSELESEISGAGAVAVEREQELFIALRRETAASMRELSSAASFLADIDAIQSLAWIASERGYCRPVLCETNELVISGGRHPVVEAHLPSGAFVENDLSLGGEHPLFGLVTGPNMAGKSTVLRQTALIVLMAHMGSFVPAESARIGAVDRIFCRVGASDNIARGESTFLVEMNETSNILRNAGPRSLVIMDEVGRGTGTHDGLAIAWATIEFILERVASRTLFATHYHELTQIEHADFMNLSMAVEHEPEIVFLKRLVAGAEDRSYGIDVARLAGMPNEVVFRARALLESFQTDGPVTPVQVSASVPVNGNRTIPGVFPQQELFPANEIVAAEIRAINPDELTPRGALDLLYRLRTLLREEDR